MSVRNNTARHRGNVTETDPTDATAANRTRALTADELKRGSLKVYYASLDGSKVCYFKFGQAAVDASTEPDGFLAPGELLTLAIAPRSNDMETTHIAFYEATLGTATAVVACEVQ